MVPVLLVGFTEEMVSVEEDVGEIMVCVEVCDGVPKIAVQVNVSVSLDGTAESNCLIETQ